MFGFLTRAVFGLEITEKNGVIRISGIRADLLIDDINKTFSTTRVTVHMFNKATRSYVEFYSFFAIDIEYIIRKLAAKKTTRLGKRGYMKMQEAMMTNTWLSGLDKIHPSIFNKSKLKEIKFDLLKHQAEFIDYYDRVIPRYNLRGILMAATPGSGKTISAIAVSCAYEARNVIIVCPKNAVFRVWEKTLLEDMNKEQTVWVHASKKPMPEPSNNRWFIFHYEALGDAVALASKLSNTRCTVVLDESHNLNEMKSLRTERFVTMCRSMKDSLIVELSGTPMKAMGAEAIPLISAIDPLFNDKCVEKFKKIYGREAKAATEILANRLGIIMYKVNKEESKIEEPVEHTLKVEVPNSERFTLDTIKKDMIEFITQRTKHYKDNKKQYENMYYSALKEFEANGFKKMTKPEQYKTYQTYIKEFIKFGYDPFSSAPKALFCNEFEKKIIQPSLSQKSRKEFKMAKSVIKYVDLKIRGECLGTVLSRARTQCNMAVLDALDLAQLIDGAEKKTLVFTSYVEVVKAAAVKLEKQGYSPLMVYADTNANLPAMVSQFGKDESINPMIATFQSLSTAVPLTMANRIILLNSPFRIHEKEQTVARANRIGQDRTVDVYNILLDTGDEPNISTRSSDIMEWSRDQVNAIMGFDNDDNKVSAESLQEDENLIDIEYVEPMEIQNDILVDNFNKEPVMVDDTITTENRFDTALNQINTITNYINHLDSNLAIGITPTNLSLEMYHIINKPITNITTESINTRMGITVLSLEQEQSRSKTILTKMLDFLITLFDALMEYIDDASRRLKDNVGKCEEIKRYLKKSDTKAFTNSHGDVYVNGAQWLTRGSSINPIDHLRDVRWQSTANSKIVNILNTDFAQMGREFERKLDKVSKPGVNLMPEILKQIQRMNHLMIEGNRVRNETNDLVISGAMLGGRQFVLRYPKMGDAEHLVKHYSMFHLKTRTIDNFDIDIDKKIEPLNRGQSLELLELVINANKQIGYVYTVIQNINKDVKSYIKKARNVNERQDETLTDRDLALITAQIGFMTAGLKAAASFTKEFVRINDRSSKASIRYVLASAAGPEAE